MCPTVRAKAMALPEPVHQLYPAFLAYKSVGISLGLIVALCPIQKKHLPGLLRQNLLQKTVKEKINYGGTGFEQNNLGCIHYYYKLLCLYLNPDTFCHIPTFLHLSFLLLQPTHNIHTAV
jgi:hypothetical protein